MNSLPERIQRLLLRHPPLHLTPFHPIQVLSQRISQSLGFRVHDALSPIVTCVQNFDSLNIPREHPSRSPSDTYYMGEKVLRTHTSAHQVELLAKGYSDFIVVGPVFRRDEVDRFHYPAFHQLEAVKVFRDLKQVEVAVRDQERRLKDADVQVKVVEDAVGGIGDNPYQQEHDRLAAQLTELHLKQSLLRMVQDVFAQRLARADDALKVRWIPAYFPFTLPSFELEIWLPSTNESRDEEGKWLEVLGCGVIHQAILDNASRPRHEFGWAVGLGLERIAMSLYNIPDVRIFWSEDARILEQWRACATDPTREFKPVSKYPPSIKDVSFWLGDKEWNENDFYELVRSVAGDLVEDVRLVDEFTNKTGKQSKCYRLSYRAMDRTVTNDEINEIQEQVRQAIANHLGVQLR